MTKAETECRIYQIEALHFCAGVIVSPEGVVKSAPRILRYSIGWTLEKLEDYCKKKKWKIMPVA